MWTMVVCSFYLDFPLTGDDPTFFLPLISHFSPTPRTFPRWPLPFPDRHHKMVHFSIGDNIMPKPGQAGTKKADPADNPCSLCKESTDQGLMRLDDDILPEPPFERRNRQVPHPRLYEDMHPTIAEGHMMAAASIKILSACRYSVIRSPWSISRLASSTSLS